MTEAEKSVWKYHGKALKPGSKHITPRTLMHFSDASSVLAKRPSNLGFEQPTL